MLLLLRSNMKVCCIVKQIELVNQLLLIKLKYM